MKKLSAVIILASLLFGCNEKKETSTSTLELNRLAEQYVRLGLNIGQYDADFVDAYYGPDSLKPDPKDSLLLTVFPKDSLLTTAATLQTAFNHIISAAVDDTIKNRAKWMNSQLTAFIRRIKIFSGEPSIFDEASKDLFGVVAPAYPEAHYKKLLATLNSLVPGKGNLQSRMKTLSEKFVIPKNKLDTVFKTAIAEARKRTLAHYNLPESENFTLEYVTNKPWGGYNWYKGNYQSVIQINTDLPLMIDRAIDLACHEGYPGHHVYNILLEKKLYRDNGWVEISLYPLFSPQSLIAEGSANFGIEVAFPGTTQQQFAKEVLLPLAGIDTTGAGAYFAAISIKKQLNYARNEAARMIVNGSGTEADALRWLQDYALFGEDAAKKSIGFIKKYGSYVINYNYGQDMVKNYIESKGGTETNAAKRWELFEWLLSNQVISADLLK
ncbi:MAG: hypothetical protein H7Y86_12590 [Rhizobacter sp.]|nr:hypothetical protein [Ferruginibacter sp.]